MEIWKPVVGYEGSYEVSSMGKIRSLDRMCYGPRLKDGQFRKGKVLRGNILQDGYEQVRLFQNGKGEYIKVHRIVAEAFIPNPQNKIQVNHINGIKHDNRADNLEWVSPSENMRHAYDVLKIPTGKGRKHGPSIRRKLTKEQVEAIRKDPRTNTRIAKDYNVCQQTISNVKLGYFYQEYLNE